MNILLAGATGAMGKVVTEVVANENDFAITAGFGLEDKSFNGNYPIYNSLMGEIKESVDVILDFSVAELIEEILDYALKNKLPLVIAATGHTKEQQDLIEEASESIPILYSGNMSLGINVMTEVVRSLSKNLAGFDIEIVEKHHKFKIDAPSGTAKMLYNSVNEGRDNTLVPVYNRQDRTERRKENEVGVFSVRGGSIVGEHTVIYAGEDEILEVRHQAGSKKIFAVGALKACTFIQNKKPGLYSMKDIFRKD